jgi:hypothetical protein
MDSTPAQAKLMVWHWNNQSQDVGETCTIFTTMEIHRLVASICKGTMKSAVELNH